MRKTSPARLFLSLFAACLLALSLATPAFAKVVVNETIPVHGIFNTGHNCGLEEIEGSFVFHHTVRETTDETGLIFVTEHYNTTGVTGVGLTTGTKFGGSEVEKDQYYTLDGVNPTVLTSVVNVEFISKGSAPNIILRVHLTMTFDSKGNVTSSIESYDLQCKG